MVRSKKDWEQLEVFGRGMRQTEPTVTINPETLQAYFNVPAQQLVEGVDCGSLFYSRATKQLGFEFQIRGSQELPGCANFSHGLVSLKSVSKRYALTFTATSYPLLYDDSSGLFVINLNPDMKE